MGRINNSILTSILISILLLSLLPSIASAQDFGIKVGVTRSTISLTDEKQSIAGDGYLETVLGPAVSPMIGVFSDIISKPSFAIQASASYLHIGSSKTRTLNYWDQTDNFDAPPRHADFTTTIGVQYLQLSVAFQPKYSLGGATVYISIEPSLNYAFSFTNFLLTQGNPSLIPGMAGAVGVELARVDGRSITAELKYYHDLIAFYDVSYARMWNSYLSLDVGVQLWQAP